MKNKEKQLSEFEEALLEHKDIIIPHYMSATSVKRELRSLKSPVLSRYTANQDPEVRKDLIYEHLVRDNSARIQEISIILEACNCKLWKSYMELGCGWGIVCSSMAKNIFSREDKDECRLLTVDFKDNRITNGLTSRTRQKNIRDIIEKKQYNNWSHSDIGADDYFKNNKPKLDVAFIDGDHSFKQTTKDWDNVSSCLSNNGIVFMHDLTMRTQSKKYPAVALKAFELIPDEEWDKYILDTPFRLGVVHRKSAEDTKEWLHEKIKYLNIKVRPWEKRRDK